MQGSSRRERFARLLDRTGALDAIVKWRERVPVPWVSVLAYHRFPHRAGEEQFDEGVIDTTVEEFERQVICMKKHFNVVGTEELCAFARGAALPKNPVAITFDDGYRSVYEHALPILARHDCRAIAFIATSFITERRLYWWDRVAYILKQSERDSVTLTYPIPLTLDLRRRSHAIQRVLRLIKGHAGLDLERLLGELAAAAGVSYTREMDRAFADELLMTWEQIRGLRAAGLDVESHTRSHRVLCTLSPTELEDELRGSREDLTLEIGEAPRALAYPVGNPLARDSGIRGALLRAGYGIGFTNGTGPTPLGKAVDPFGIGRQTVGRGLTEAYQLAILAVPMLAPKHPWHLVGGAHAG